MVEVKTSKVRKNSLEEKTVFELFGSDKAEEPFLKVEYPRIIYLELGDSVNVTAEAGSSERRVLGQDGIPGGHNEFDHFPSNMYIVRKSETNVNMVLSIGGERNPLEKYYTLVRSGKGY